MLKDEMDVLRHSQEKVVCTGLLHAYLQELHNFWNFILNDFPKIKGKGTCISVLKTVFQLKRWSSFTDLSLVWQTLTIPFSEIFLFFFFFVRRQKFCQKMQLKCFGPVVRFYESTNLVPFYLGSRSLSFWSAIMVGTCTILKRCWILLVVLKSPWIQFRSLKSSLFLIRSWNVFEIHNLVYSRHLFCKIRLFCWGNFGSSPV